MHFRVLVLTTVLCVAALAGCTGPSESNQPTPDGNTTVPPTDPNGNGSATQTGHFRVASLEILRPDGRPGELYEDDGGAIVRYTIEEPADAPRAETAFVTYYLNGRIVDVQQLKLEPGQNKTFERRIGDLRDHKVIRVEVRAASSVARAEATVQEWPRAGRDTLILGPLQVRADFGFMEQDGRVLINLTLNNVGPEETLRDFRAKVLCALPNGTIRSTNSVRLDAPTTGNNTGIDALLDDCNPDETRYGVEFKARGEGDRDLVGRLLLVPKGWRPAGNA
ncbi:MAG TPA: hypothetical protein VFH78_02695 [Candidatus Thermoplasmatota archaeon]|nr:hypothetical protein [Candidatus Thermoplasmatota archaeon]